MTIINENSVTDGREFIKLNPRHDANALTSIGLIKYTAGLDETIDPAAYSLQMLLVTHYDSSSKSGVINPKPSRVKHQLGLTDDPFAEALAHLLRSGNWNVPLDIDPTDPTSLRLDWTKMTIAQIKMTLLSYGIDNITEFIPTYIAEAKAAKEALADMRVSLNHIKYLCRFTGKRAGLEHAISVLVSTRIAPHYQDLGYGYYRKKGLVSPYQLINSKGQPRKIVHSVWFDHWMLKAWGDEAWKRLLDTRELTDDMVSNSRTAEIPFAELVTKFGTGENPVADVTKALQEIGKIGYFKVWFAGDPDADSMTRTVIFTPTKQMHDAIWNHDYLAGGEALTAWEVENGHIPWSELGEGNNPMTDLPKLGYHWLYLTKSRKTGKYLTVGQTTVPLNVRKDQHKTYGSNPTIDAVIRSINEDPEDELMIECLGLVHHHVTSKIEMFALEEMLMKGHKLYNALTDARSNAHTIYPDARFKKMPKWKQQEELKASLAQYGEVIFCNFLPEYTPDAYVEQQPVYEGEAPF
jgi:hypothetical protein